MLFQPSSWRAFSIFGDTTLGAPQLWPDLDNDPFASAFEAAVGSAKPRVALIAPDTWSEWLKALFARHFYDPFAPRHEEFWKWVWAIDIDSEPRPFVGIWPRGGGKSTNAEAATASLGIRGKRKYCLYVRETQEQADKSVANIAALLESLSVERHYPEHAERRMSKFGASRGWRRNRLMTSGGFTVDAIGLDTAARGVKVEEQRPDLIVVDDLDDKHDSPDTTAKKIATVTTSLLPAGASNVAVLAIQNLIIPDGIFTRLADGRADFLADRIVSGPYPAIQGMHTEWRIDDETQTRKAIITAGEATWEGQSLEKCQRLIDTMGLGAFLKECQHRVKERAEGVALRYDERKHLETLTDDQAKALVALGRTFAGIDFGSWRFFFTLRAVDREGRVHQIAELFSQKENLETRAKKITAICSYYGIPGNLKMWGDAANPTDITELNAAFQRIGSPYHVIAVAAENKIRKVSVDRLNELLDRQALFYRRGVHAAIGQILGKEFKRPPLEFMGWRHGMNASGMGSEQEGSRLQWELQSWSYPAPREGVAQSQDPDDDTADGADGIAAERYGIMSWWRPAKPKEDEEFSAFDPKVLEREAVETRTLRNRKKRRKLNTGLDHGGY